MGSEQLVRAKKYFFIALVIDLLLSVIVILNALRLSSSFMVIQGGSLVPDEAFFASLHTHDNLTYLTFLTTCGIGYLLVRWLKESYKFARESIGASGFERNTGVGWWWLVPFYNLFRPYQTISELYKLGSHRYSKPQDWKDITGSFALLSWWIYYVIAHLIMIIIVKTINRISLREDVNLNQVISIYEAQTVVFCISISIVILWFFVANHLTNRLVEKAASPITEDDGTEPLITAATNTPANTPAPELAVALKTPDAGPSRLTIPVSSMSESDDWAFEKVADELETSTTDKVLWTRVFAESGGEESKAKALYIQRRVAGLLEAEKKRLAEEVRARTIETQRQKDLQDELERIRALETRREEEIRLVEAETLAKVEREKIEATEKARQIEGQERHDQEEQEANLDRLEKIAAVLKPPNQSMSIGAKITVAIGITAVALVVLIGIVAPDTPSKATAPATASTPAVPFGPDYTKIEDAELKGKAATDATAAYHLMLRYRQSREGVARDFTQSFYWGEIAANQGHSRAQAVVGWYYTAGIGIPEDKQKGLMWLEKSAAQNDPMGLSNLGWRYQIGDGVQLDYQKAFEYAKRASDLGDHVGRNNLAELYEKGHGVPKDYTKALPLFESVAVMGYQTDPILGMIRIYADQSGNYNYPVVAYAWLRIALEKPYDKEELQPHMNELMALKQLLEARLSPTQIEIARVKASNWKKGDYLRP